MKQYEVYMNLTISVTVEVEAESLEQAEKLAIDKVDYDNGYYVRKYDSLLDREVTEVHECEDEDTNLKKAIRYIRENMDGDDLAILRAECNKCYNSHLIPTFSLVDADKVRELLDEYGEENSLDEDWYEDYDEDEILSRL